MWYISNHALVLRIDPSLFLTWTVSQTRCVALLASPPYVSLAARSSLKCLFFTSAGGGVQAIYVLGYYYNRDKKKAPFHFSGFLKVRGATPSSGVNAATDK
jgi:hypothetical protein